MSGERGWAGEVAAPYRLVDEPDLGENARWRRFAVDPGWPMLGLMLAGAWAAWPWFWLNGQALGSPTRARERLWIAAGVGGSAAGGLLLLALLAAGVLRGAVALQLGLLVITAWKLGVATLIFKKQAAALPRLIEAGGEAQSGVGALLLAIFVGRALVLGLVDGPLWWIIVSGVF
ncbi:MAG: hypothetical protein IPK80_18950 [Nannocystis sp.]|nr:hypothetical protein [Nannocystis sp.]